MNAGPIKTGFRTLDDADNLRDKDATHTTAKT
jgi:hypothetical protein